MLVLWSAAPPSKLSTLFPSAAALTPRGRAARVHGRGKPRAGGLAPGTDDVRVALPAPTAAPPVPQLPASVEHPMRPVPMMVQVAAQQLRCADAAVLAGVSGGVSSSDTARAPEKFRLPAANPKGLAAVVSGTTRVMRRVGVVIENSS